MEKVREWQPRLVDRRRPLVGIAWKGNPRQVNDRQRSLTAEDAVALSRRAPRATFVNLQAGEPRPPGADWIDAGSGLRDWDDTAAIVSRLDLVIAVDTAFAQLAGAMQKPVWLLRWFSLDWRWGASGETTRWYPSMRLFWQRAPGSWAEVLDAVAARLAAFPTSPTSPARGVGSRP